MRQGIIISGFGGQGVMIAGALLCYAGMKDGKFVTFFPSYGAEIRGGTANCQVVISDEAIGAPVIYNPDILIALNQLSYKRFYPRVKNGGIIFANTSLYTPDERKDAEIIEIPANDIAEKCGNPIFANMVMIGALLNKKDIVKLDSVINSLSAVLPGKKNLWQGNKQAIEAGFSHNGHRRRDI